MVMIMTLLLCVDLEHVGADPRRVIVFQVQVHIAAMCLRVCLVRSQSKHLQFFDSKNTALDLC